MAVATDVLDPLALEILESAPPADFVPEPVRGHPVVGCIVCYAGDPEEGEQVMQPLREFGPPGLDLLGAMPYVAVQQLLDDANPHGVQNYWSADFYDALPDEAVDVALKSARYATKRRRKIRPNSARY